MENINFTSEDFESFSSIDNNAWILLNNIRLNRENEALVKRVGELENMLSPNDGV